MKQKHIRLVIDVLTTLILPVLMAYELVGRGTHEWLGVAMLVLILIHHIINRSWYARLFKGKYTKLRTLMTALDLALTVLIILQGISGISLARYARLPSPLIPRSIARQIHMAGAYWSFALMCVHAGLHTSTMVAKAKGALAHCGVWIGRLCKLFVWLFAGYGLFAFIKRDLFEYMTLQIQFAFLDFGEPLIFFFADYVAIMALLMFAGHGLKRLLSRR